jgi:hypothetical protein
VTDEEDKPIFDAIFSYRRKIITNTDADGICSIELSKYDTLCVYYLGYEKYQLTSHQLLKTELLNIRMIPKVIEIEEIIVRKSDYFKILKTAQYNYQKLYPVNNWIGYGNYEKTTKQNGKFVDFTQHNGYIYFMGGLNNSHIPSSINMMILPEHSRCSYFFQNTTKYSQMNQSFSANLSFNANNSVIWEYYSIVEQFGPQIPRMFKYYNYQIAGIIDSVLIVNFYVKDKFIPRKIKINARGKMHINLANEQLSKIEFDQIVTKYSYSKHKSSKSSPNYISTLVIRYVNLKDAIFPKTINTETHWIKDVNACSEYPLTPTRLNQGKTKLVDYECIDLSKVNQEKIDYTVNNFNLFSLFAFMSLNVKINYDSEFWVNSVTAYTPSHSEIFEDLSQVTSIEGQFKSGHNKFRMDSVYLDFVLVPEYISSFYNLWNKKSEIFNKLSTLNYEIIP